MFLATTALESFWDKNQRLVFLGDWCKLYSRRAHWSRLDYVDAPFVWDNTDQVLEGIKYCQILYDRLLPALSEQLNVIHDIDRDNHYYKIILGDWLIHYIHQLYDKYKTVSAAKNKYGHLETFVLDRSQFCYILDHNDFLNKLYTDAYSLQIYSKIIEFMGIPSSAQRLENPLKQGELIESGVLSPGWKNQLLNVAFACFTRLCNKLSRKPQVLVTCPYFGSRSIQSKFSLWQGGKGKVVLDDLQYPIAISCSPNLVTRGQLKLRLPDSGDEFENIVASFIPSDIPLLFVEGFQEMRRLVAKLPISKPEICFTANALEGHNTYKFLLGDRYPSVTSLDMQHGGGYGFDLVNIPEEYEKSVSDLFYTSGWVKNEKTRPLPIPKLLGLKRRSSTQKVLFVINEMPRYVYRLHFHPSSSGYLRHSLCRAIDFLRKVDVSPVIVRTYPQGEYGWETNSRIEEAIPGIVFDGLEISFESQLARSKMMLSNHIGTTFLQSLAADVPTIVFINDRCYRLHPVAERHFHSLEKAGVLHWSAGSAANHYNRVIEDLDSWWHTDEVQQARKQFVENFAGTSTDWVSQWVREFDRVLNK